MLEITEEDLREKLPAGLIENDLHACMSILSCLQL
jgi:hypothetical protein